MHTTHSLMCKVLAINCYRMGDLQGIEKCSKQWDCGVNYQNFASQDNNLCAQVLEVL